MTKLNKPETNDYFVKGTRLEGSQLISNMDLIAQN